MTTPSPSRHSPSSSSSGSGAVAAIPALSPSVATSTSPRVSFVCQRCLQPLRIDNSFKKLNEHSAAEIKLPICVMGEEEDEDEEDVELQGQLGEGHKIIKPIR